MGYYSIVIMLIACIIEIANLANEGPDNHLIAVIGMVVLALGWAVKIVEKKYGI